jgi:hypothetical protein
VIFSDGSVSGSSYGHNQVDTLTGISGVIGIGTSAAANVIYVSNASIATDSSHNSGITTTSTYDETGYSSVTLGITGVSGSASTVVSTVTNLGAAGQLVIAGTANYHLGQISVGQIGTAGGDSLAVQFATAAAGVVDKLTVSGDYALTISNVDTSDTGVITSLVDGATTNTLTSIAVSGSGAVTLTGITDTALTTITSTATGTFTLGNGSYGVAPTAAISTAGLSVTIGSSTATYGWNTLFLSGAGDKISFGSDALANSSAGAGLQYVVASGAGDTISFANGHVPYNSQLNANATNGTAAWSYSYAVDGQQATTHSSSTYTNLASGDTVTIKIDGISDTYSMTSSDTTNSTLMSDLASKIYTDYAALGVTASVATVNGQTSLVIVGAAADGPNITGVAASNSATVSLVSNADWWHNAENVVYASGAGDTLNASGGDNVFLGGNGSSNSTALGAGDIINLKDGGTTNVADTVAAGIANTINLIGNATLNAAGTSSTVFGQQAYAQAVVFVTNDTYGAAGNMTVINGANLLGQYGHLSLVFNNTTSESTLGTAAGSITAMTNSQINTSEFTSLTAALNAAVKATSGSTSAGVIDWFQYGGNTYIVEAVQGSAAHTTLASGDVVIQLTGVVDLHASTWGSTIHTLGVV